MSHDIELRKHITRNLRDLLRRPLAWFFIVLLTSLMAWGLLGQEDSPSPTSNGEETATAAGVGEPTSEIPSEAPSETETLQVSFVFPTMPKPSAQAGELQADRCRALVYLTLFDAEGKPSWQGLVPCNAEGNHRLLPEHLPDIPRSVKAQLSAEAKGFLAASTPLDLIVDSTKVDNTKTGSTKVTAHPSIIPLHLQPINRWLPFLFLFPAFLGLGGSVSHLLRLRPSESPASLGLRNSVNHLLRHLRPSDSLAYSQLCSLVWVLVLTVYGVVFLRFGDHWMVLFWPGVVISTGVVVFAFLGTLTYVAFSIYDKREGFFDENLQRSKRDKYFRALGGRILIAPYVAVVLQAILTPSFPALRGGPAALFLAFFTGLWIKVVLNILHDIGGRFLSANAAQRVVERLKSQDESNVPPPRSADALTLRPPSPFFDAVRQARKQLHELPGVVGVGPGTKVTDGQETQQQAIVVYVYEKRQLNPGDAEHIPSIIAGVRTDVVELPSPIADSPCHTPALDYFWDKIYRDHQRSRGTTQPAAPNIQMVDNVMVLTLADVQDAFFKPNVRSDQKFVPRLAYDQIRARLGDSYHFIAFVLDLDSDVRPQGSYYVAAHNDVAGIHFFKDPAPLDRNPSGRFSERTDWGSVRLLGCQVHGQGRTSLTPWSLLHELGHAWCAYLPSPPQLPPHLNLVATEGGGAGHHWHEALENGISCMDYDRKRWVHVKEDIYEQVPVTMPQVGFSDLDLYLMGFKSSQDVATLRMVVKKRAAEAANAFHVDIHEVEIQDLVNSLGRRKHTDGVNPTIFRQAFVVVSQDADSGRRLAEHVNSLLPDHEQRFKDTTGATLITKLVS